MQLIAKRIEIVSSTLKGFSSMSQRSRLATLGVLSSYYYDVKITIINSQLDLDAMVLRQPDLVFLGMRYIPSKPSLGLADPNKVWLSSYLDDNNIAYTGSGAAAHNLDLNKDLAKQRLVQHNLATSPFFLAKQGVFVPEIIPINYPVFIKPSNRGGGLGIDHYSVAHSPSQLRKKVESITKRYHTDSLIEQYLPGREFSVAVIRPNTASEYMAMPIELIAEPNNDGVSILGYDTKSSNAEQVVNVTNPPLRKAVIKLALDSFYALGGRDYGRIDIRLDAAGNPNFLEANLIPSLIAGYGSFPKACLMQLGLGYDDMILRLAQLGLERSPNHSQQATGSSVGQLATPLAV